jgi:uncharacterized protein (TIGR02391 family)
VPAHECGVLAQIRVRNLSPVASRHFACETAMTTSKHLTRLRESLSLLRAFKQSGVNAYSPEFKAWQQRTARALDELFGPTHYLRSFEDLHFCEPRVQVMTSGSSKPQWLPMDQSRFDDEIVQAEQLIVDAISDAEESVPATRESARPAVGGSIWTLIHPVVAAVARERFDAGHYADAAETAFKAVNMRVKQVSRAAGEAEKDGKALMLSALSVNRPVIPLDDLSTESGKNIQEGYMHIFAGAMQAIRNPKAHEIVTITPERALHFLILASLLMSKLDDAAV